MSNSKLNEIKVDLAKWLGQDTAPSAEASLRDFGLDSLDVVEMSLELQNKYGVEFSVEELASLKSWGDLYAGIESKLA